MPNSHTVRRSTAERAELRGPSFPPRDNELESPQLALKKRNSPAVGTLSVGARDLKRTKRI